jgi:hypothetical protein
LHDRPSDFQGGSRSEVVLEFVINAFCGETASEIAIPSGDPSAQVSYPGLAEPVFSEVVVGEYADASQMVQDCFQVEVRVMTAGKVLKIDVGDRAGDGTQVDDVADDEAVMPSARFGGPRCRRATMPARLPRDLAGPIPSVVLAPL